MIEIEYDANGQTVISSKNFRLSPSIKERFSWCEYIVRCGWMPDSQR